MRYPRFLLVGFYPLDRLDRAPKVRIMRMAESLSRITSLRVIVGSRRERARRIHQAWARNVLADIDAVYVESASSFATPVDILFLWQVKRRQIPLAIYVRDYYQHFPELYPPKNFREHVMTWLYVLTLYFYRRLATIIYVPSRELGRLVGGSDVRVLPPGGQREIVTPAVKAGSGPEQWVLYVGAQGPYDGVNLLIEAVHRLHHRMPQLRLALVMRRKEWPQISPVPYVNMVEAQGNELDLWYRRASLAVIPRLNTAYTKMAWPVKLMDYLSHGLGVVVTDDSEAARFVERYQVGQRCQPDSESLAETLENCLQSPWLLDQYRKNALRVIAQEHSWDHRAATVVSDLLPRMQQSNGTSRTKGSSRTGGC